MLLRISCSIKSYEKQKKLANKRPNALYQLQVFFYFSKKTSVPKKDFKCDRMRDKLTINLSRSVPFIFELGLVSGC